MAETAELRMSEAVPLAHALVARLAELEGVRVLFIKGPTAAALGARPPRPSTDVDVLCEPGGLERLGPALERCGWRPRVTTSSIQTLEHASAYLFEHSVHYIHDEWPCDLDVHFNFPGFLAPDDVVFEELWDRRTSVEVANWPVPAADLIGQAAIVGLHALRDPDRPQSQVDLGFLQRILTKAELYELSELSSATGAAVTLGILLPSDLQLAPAPWEDEEALHRWRTRTRTESGGTYWLIELRLAPWSQKPKVLRRALFLPPDELYSVSAAMPLTRRNTARLHLQRWGRAFRYLPRSIRAARRSDESSS